MLKLKNPKLRPADVLGYTKIAITLQPIDDISSQKYYVNLGTVENHGKKMVKNTADFFENRKNHGKDTASNHGPKDHYTVYKSQHMASMTIVTYSARFSSATFCHCGALTNSRNTF